MANKKGRTQYDPKFKLEVVKEIIRTKNQRGVQIKNGVSYTAITN
jgi:hypothetical protein